MDYFSHDLKARSDMKMVRLFMKHGMEGIGIFWCLVEMLYEEEGFIQLSELDRIAFELRVEYDRINSVLRDFDLFRTDEKRFWSDSVLKRIDIRIEKSAKNKQNVEKRWQKYKRNTTVLPSNESGNTGGNTLKESKGKEIERKENEMKELPPKPDFSDKTDLFTKHMTLIHPQSKALAQTLVIANKHRDYDFLWEKMVEIWRSAGIEPNPINHYGYFCNLRELAVIACADLQTRKALNGAIPGCDSFLRPYEGKYAWEKAIVPLGKKTANNGNPEPITHLPKSQFNG